MVRSWLNASYAKGSLIIDPLGANPMAALEAAREGFRVFFSRNNPILWLILEVMALSPEKESIKTAVNQLLISRIGEETLESHIKSLYATPCAGCGCMIQPIGFIWKKDSELPHSRIYSCPNCGDEGKRNISQHDIEIISGIGISGLHRKRAFQRVLQGGEYEQESIETALDCYLPRAIYTVMTIVNTLDRLSMEKEQKRILLAALLTVFDEASSLWHWPEKKHRHLILNIPSQFIEKNLWLSLENIPETWLNNGDPVPVSYWPNMPPQGGGICFYNRRLLDEKNFFSGLSADAAVCVFPRPNQAFWTLSALWSGWLWGKKGVHPMRSALARRRYDWYWFAQAIQATMEDVYTLPGLEKKMFGIFPQAAANYYLGLLLGAGCSGFHYSGSAFRESRDTIQIHWREAGSKEIQNSPDWQMVISDYLSIRGEPAPFNDILLQGINAFASGIDKDTDLDKFDDGLFKQIQEKISSLLHSEHFAVSFPSSSAGGSLWWLTDPSGSAKPLSERVEIQIRDFLNFSENSSLYDIDRQICEKFPGPATPSRELVISCLESYSDTSINTPSYYSLRREDLPESRQKDLDELKEILTQCGKKFGMRVMKNELYVTWQGIKGDIVYSYVFSIESPKLETLQSARTGARVVNVMVFPGSRSGLFKYRMRNDPRLSAAAEDGWHFLKFRYLRRMAARDNLTLSMWEELLDGDPPLWDSPTQIQLL
ncbi:MAG TPA: hypothetical protein ENH70_05160 [Desulfobacteraceae bacterium]|nr:hypothetical protein [Desulfobacteraceae bacterium]